MDHQQEVCDGFRIMYVHVPAHFTAMGNDVVKVAVAAILTLVWRVKIVAICMHASARIGACWFTSRFNNRIHLG